MLSSLSIIHAVVLVISVDVFVPVVVVVVVVVVLVVAVSMPVAIFLKKISFVDSCSGWRNFILLVTFISHSFLYLTP